MAEVMMGEELHPDRAIRVEKLYEILNKYETPYSFPIAHEVENNAFAVVMCGECQFYDTDDCPMSGTPGRVSASDFCSYGERRQTNEKKQTNPQDEDQKMGGGTGSGNAVPSA